MLRRCTKCHSEFPATTDYFRPAQQGRLRGECKSCTARDHAARYQKDKAKRNAVNREWVKRNRDARRRHTKNYRDKNGDKCREAVRRWFDNDPDHAREVNRQKTNRWFRNNIEKGRAIRRAAVKKRKALKRGASESRLTRQEWDAIQAKYDHRCAYCYKKVRLTQDHVIPLSKGGSHTADNVVPACMTCNCSKQDGPPPKPVQPLLLP